MCRRCKDIEPTGGLERVGGVDSVFGRPRPETGTCSTGRDRRKKITRHPWEIEMKKQQAIDDCTCPVCGYYSSLNGGLYKTVWGFFHDREYALYECKKCGTKWQIRIR